MQKRSLQTFALTVFITSFSLVTHAATSAGTYIGIMFGPATNDGSPQNAQVTNKNRLEVTTVKPKSKQFGSRLYIGYQMNNYAGFELGFSFFTSIHYSQQFPDLQLCSTPGVRVRSIELLGKAIFPFYYFDLYGKAGPAAIYTTTTGGLNPEFNKKKSITCGKSKHITKWDPAFSIGASFSLNQSFVTDISMNTILTGGLPKRITWAALGLSYHWVDVYCGQFLCD